MHKDRAMLVALGVLGLAFGAYHLRQGGPGAGWLPDCTFRGLTGLDCPGCGMTRGSHAMLNGRFLEGFLFNPVGMVLLPVAMAGVGLELLGWVRGEPLPWRMRVGKRGSWGIFIVIMVFWIGRNLW